MGMFRQLTNRSNAVSEANVRLPGQEGHLLLWQIHLRKIVVNDPAARNDLLDADVDVKCSSVFRQRNKFCNPEPTMGF
jgi:hypothetical protein